MAMNSQHGEPPHTDYRCVPLGQRIGRAVALIFGDSPWVTRGFKREGTYPAYRELTLADPSSGSVVHLGQVQKWTEVLGKVVYTSDALLVAELEVRQSPSDVGGPLARFSYRSDLGSGGTADIVYFGADGKPVEKEDPDGLAYFANLAHVFPHPGAVTPLALLGELACRLEGDVSAAFQPVVMPDAEQTTGSVGRPWNPLLQAAVTACLG